MPPKINLKDKVEDGEIDLSLLDLQEVPVREISLVRNAHSLDLSNNQLVALPKTFPSLTNLIKLDLSKNKLAALPENFGDLYKLKHLDLYKNELQHLPLSFSKLKALRWLDLKDNPLVPALRETAGECLDGKQCQSCARNIVSFFTELEEKVKLEREARERQRMKEKLNNEAAAMKNKVEKKKKKKEKVKTNQENGVEPLEKYQEVLHTDVQDLKKKDASLLGVLFVKLMYFLAITAFGLFLATSIRWEFTESIRKKVIIIWKDLVLSLPEGYRGLGHKISWKINNLHEATGWSLLKIRDYIAGIKSAEQLYKDALYGFNIFVGRVTKIYNNIFSNV